MNRSSVRKPPAGRPVLATSAATLFLAVVPLHATAADTKYFNGAFCRAGSDPGEPSFSGDADYSTNGSIANNSTTETLNFVCPIVRDNTANIGGWDSVEVGYFDKSPDAITCTAKSAQFDGVVIWNQPGFSSNTAGASWAKAGMIFNDPLAVSAVNGFHYLHCVVPPKVCLGAVCEISGIAYYRVEEP